MGNNTTGGIILFIVGAVIITMGVSEKGKRIFNILVGGGSSESPATKESVFDESKPAVPRSDSSDDPEWKKQNGNQFGFVGEKGAEYVG